MSKKILTHNLSEPLNGATNVNVDIHTGTGNLTIDKLTSDEPLLASGTLQYMETQDLPARSLNICDGRATFTLKASGKGQSLFHFPWEACNGATDWQILLNSKVVSEIKAHSGGGNIKLNLTGIPVTSVQADTGGGNVEIVLPDPTAAISVAAKSGAGSVVVQVPGGIAARIHATTGLGKVIVNPRFSKTDSNTYQSPDFDRADKKVEITISSGAGLVAVEERSTR